MRYDCRYKQTNRDCEIRNKINTIVETNNLISIYRRMLRKLLVTHWRGRKEMSMIKSRRWSWLWWTERRWNIKYIKKGFSNFVFPFITHCTLFKGKLAFHYYFNITYSRRKSFSQLPSLLTFSEIQFGVGGISTLKNGLIFMKLWKLFSLILMIWTLNQTFS